MIKWGRYKGQVSFGITLMNLEGGYRSLILEVGIWYVEYIFRDYEEDVEIMG